MKHAAQPEVRVSGAAFRIILFISGAARFRYMLVLTSGGKQVT